MAPIRQSAVFARTLLTLCLAANGAVYARTSDESHLGLLRSVADEGTRTLPMNRYPVVSDVALDDIRGGYTTTSGLELSFGIERALYIDGNLISTTSLNVSGVGSDAGTASTQSDAASTASAVAAALTDTTVPAPADVAASLAVIQTGAGNAVDKGSIAVSAPIVGGVQNVPPAAGTIIQNSQNDQRIQNITVISATVNSMEILKALNLQFAIGNAVAASVRK